MLIALLTTLAAFAFTQQTDTLGGTNQNSAGDHSYKLDTFDVLTDATLDEIEAYVDPRVNNAEIVFVVYEEGGGGQEWTLLWNSGLVPISQGASFKSSGNVGVALDAGTYYAIGYWLPDDVEYFFQDVPDNDLGYAVVDGSYWINNGQVPGGPPNTIFNGQGNSDGHHYRLRITATVPEDLDGDGFHELNDCDDGDINTYPGAPELCDYIDNNCNGQVDDNVVDIDYYADADGDGAGDANDIQTTCDGPPAGYVSNDADCDDTDAATYPGAPEICDQLDNNCNGNVDEGLPMRDWWADTDGDGFGDPDDEITTCDDVAPAGYADNDGDCDPGDGTVYPGGEEFCDGLDNDCDGEVDDNVVYRDVYLDDDGDGYGTDEDVISICEPDPPAGYAETDDDCDDTNDAIHPDANEICDGLDNDCDGEVEPDGVDLDGDGSFACEDCDDDADDVFPGAEDDCNGVDNDCDGDIPKAKDCDPDVNEKLGAACACNQGTPGMNGTLLVLLGLLGLLRRRRTVTWPS